MNDKRDDFLDGLLGVGGEIVPANPWFETFTGDIEFVKFQYDIDALGRYVDVLDSSLRSFLAQERAACDRKDFLLGVPDGWSGEAEMVAREELGKVEDMPYLAFGSALALCFMTLEQLLNDLISLTEMRKNKPAFKIFPRKRGEPYTERARRFLAEAWDVPLELDADTAEELARLRAMRNRFIHAASKEPVPGTISEPIVFVTREDVESALTTIGSYAWVLERGLEAYIETAKTDLLK